MTHDFKQNDELIALGKRIRQARVAKQLSQEALADQIGTSKSAISGYEAGKTDPSQGTVLKLAEALDVSINWLMGAKVNYEPLPDQVVVLAREAKNLSNVELEALRGMVRAFKDKEKKRPLYFRF